MDSLMKIVMKMRGYLIYLLLLFSLLLFSYGVYKYFKQETKIIPFFGMQMIQADDKHLDAAAIVRGQFTTVGEGFFVGKKVNICLMLYLKDDKNYNSFKKIATMLGVQNSINIDDSGRDWRSEIRDGELEKAFVNPGLIRLTNWYDDKKILIYEGDIIFKKEGEISFAPPLNFIRIEGVNVASEHVKYQIDSNRVALLISFIAASMGFLSLFFSLHKKY